MLASWFPSEASNPAKHLRTMKKKMPWGLYGGWTPSRQISRRIGISLILSAEDVARIVSPWGWSLFDEDYLRKSFFPSVVKGTC